MSKRTGVIVGVSGTLTVKEANEVSDLLRERFPGVQFAVVSGATSVAFEYDAPEPRWSGTPDDLEDVPEWAPSWHTMGDIRTNELQRRDSGLSRRVPAGNPAEGTEMPREAEIATEGEDG